MTGTTPMNLKILTNIISVEERCNQKHSKQYRADNETKQQSVEFTKYSSRIAFIFTIF